MLPPPPDPTAASLKPRAEASGDAPDPSPVEPFNPSRIVCTLSLLALGILLYTRTLPEHGPSTTSWLLLATAVLLAAIIRPRLDHLRAPTPRRRLLTTLCITLLTFSYLLAQSYIQSHTHYPRFHDEAMHMIHARIMSHGRLWLPAHPLPQFFESFFIFTEPVYTAMQFPGTSMLYVPGLWLGVPFWITSILIGSIAVGLLYRVTAEIIDGLAGIIAAVWLLGSFDFRSLSYMVLSYPASLMLALALLTAWLSWRVKPTTARAALLGAIAGWAMITRPSDAICVLIPVAIALILQLSNLKSQISNSPTIRRAKTLVPLTLAAAPFLLLQLLFNHGVTGSWFQTPHEMYVRQFNPQFAYTGAAAQHPTTTLPQKADYFKEWEAPDPNRFSPKIAANTWFKVRLPLMLKTDLPLRLAVIFLPLGLLGLTTRPRIVIAATLPLFVLAYTPLTVFVWTYALFPTLALIPLAILGIRVIDRLLSHSLSRYSGGRERNWRLPATGPGWGRFSQRPPNLTAPLLTFALGLGILGLPSPAVVGSEQWNMPTLAAAHQALEKIPGRAVVFFRYRPGDDVHEEPVFNTDTANIDDARIIRAHDLGPTENQKLITYYRTHQPDRSFHLFDRATKSLSPLNPEP